jgi:hypothetical protein
MLPGVDALQQSQLARRTRRTHSELVGVFHLLKELDGIVHAINVELQAVHIEGAHRYLRFAVGGEGGVAG